MQDRVSLYPGRVKLEPVAGQANTYDLTRADQPTQEGTPLNKASLLKDTTASLFGLDNTAVPDDAFSLIKTLLDTAQSTANGRARVSVGTYTGTGVFGINGKRTLTFDFPAQFLIIYNPKGQLYSEYGANKMAFLQVPRVESETDIQMYYSGDPNYQVYNKFLYNGNKVSWYAYTTALDYGKSAEYQLNKSGTTYYYIAIG